jgi:hypothetical protein
MSQPAPEPTAAPPAGRRAGGSFLTRTSILGVPNWLWITIAAVAGGTVFILWRNHEKSAAAAQTAATSATATTTQCEDANGNPVDCNSLLAVNSEGQGEYEQLTSQLQGISGQQAALASTIGQLNGQTSTTTTTGSTTAAAPANFSLPAGTPTGSAPTTASYGGQSLGQVLSALQANGYGVSSVSYAGQPVPASSISQYYSTPVYSVTTSGNTVAIGLQ